MSSVLKAMKKIEKGPDRPVAGRGQATSGDVEKIVFGTRGGARRHPFIYFFLPALSVFLLSVLFYMYNERIVHNEAAVAPFLIRSEAFVPVQDVTHLNAKKSHGPDLVIKKGVSVPYPERDMKETAARSDAPHASPPPLKEHSQGRTGVRRSPEKEMVGSGTGSQYVEPVAEKPLYEAMDLPKGASFYKVHGISWSADSARRIAVINSSVVHEGDRVADGMVVRIEKNSVVIKRDNTFYNVPF